MQYIHDHFDRDVYMNVNENKVHSGERAERVMSNEY